ncbi:MerR family transcriptional regulator [Nocardioides phosphati]|uniref:MerR family transcriptional regulator n=1 Tax=Nocardioides phosphati TaxID=1867775 RepID=A0ABQ2NAJ2_9ACTN|nr:MerR family transcriptional regulator [Nocardioides phosphati]GGO87725.1 MerR family transcriptional regulator [Nocardioides phosphati]
MSTTANRRTYTIKEAAALSGLPASTLRYYESIGVIAPVSRGESSGHRVYDEDDLDQLTGVACLSATGLSVSDMKQYVANGRRGPEAAAEQVALLEAQAVRLEQEAERLRVRRRYVALKIAYWTAVAGGDTAEAERICQQAVALADELTQHKSH